MSTKIIRFGFIFSFFLMAVNVQSYWATPQAFGMQSTVTFDNQSGEFALVKLIGPSPRRAEVGNGQSRTVSVGSGTYHILTRYGNDFGNFRYARGETFSIFETTMSYEKITITLHGVLNGNYETFGSSQAEFERAP